MCQIFDAHCDTIYELEENNLSLSCNSLHLDIERMEEFNTYIQVFAAFIDKKSIKIPPMKYCMGLINRYRREIELNKERISAIESISDLERARKSGGAYSILSLEGGEALGGSLDAISVYYNLGVRLITLTWNYTNELADGITEERGGGLTDFGRNAASIMEDMGILIDVSHLSKQGFWDVIEVTKYPFVASHSCAKALCGHIRNLDDEQIRAIIKREGCIGVNFYPDFLSPEDSCSVSDIIEHMEYIISLGGENSVGLGSDFDGVRCLPRDICGVQDMKFLAERVKEKFPKDIAEKILFENFFRVFYTTMQRENTNKKN